MVGLAGKARVRANVGLTWARRGDTLSKLRTVRKIERVYKEQYTELFLWGRKILERREREEEVHQGCPGMA